MAFRFESLEIWELAIEYGEKINTLTKRFPGNEMYSLSANLNRAFISISSNIAEGSGSNSNLEFKRFLNIAVESVFETVSQLHVANKREYVPYNDYKNAYGEAELLVKKIKTFAKSLKIS